jgi:predicted transcriptional regulator
MSHRMNLRFPPEVIETMDRLARERGLSRPAIMRQALGVLQVAHDAAKEGHYVGLTRTRENLETLLVAPL